MPLLSDWHTQMQKMDEVFIEWFLQEEAKTEQITKTRKIKIFEFLFSY